MLNPHVWCSNPSLLTAIPPFKPPSNSSSSEEHFTRIPGGCGSEGSPLLDMPTVKLGSAEGAKAQIPKIAGIFRGFITFLILIHTKFGWFHWNFTLGSVYGLKSQFGPCLQPVPTIQVLPSQKSSVPISDVISHPTCDHIPRNRATQAREKALAAVATASRTRAQGALSIGQLATWDMKKTGSLGTLSHFEVKVRLSTGKPSPSKYQKHGKLRSHFFEWKNWEKKHAHSKIGINTHFRSKKKCSNFTEDWDKWNGMGHPKIGLGRCF